MATIEENYVSFETAKLLKEKGFDVPCMGRYSVRSKEFHLDCTRLCNNGGLFECSAPTLQMAMKWLREVHNIGIFPSTYTHIVDRKTIHSYGTAIINLKTYELMTDNYLSNDTYEDAVETAIKYCLENLI